MLRGAGGDDGERAARIIQDALGIENNDLVNYCFPEAWPANREQRARIIGKWLQEEACIDCNRTAIRGDCQRKYQPGKDTRHRR